MNLQAINASASPEVQMNENFETLDHQSVYGLRQPVTTGLTWGYCGGRWGGFSVAAATLALAASATNYVVVEIATGAISVATTSTNWDDAANYLRVYKLTTGASAVTAIEDHRAGPLGVHGGSGAGGGGGSYDLAADIHAATDKATPVDADELALVDSEASYGLKKLTWTNLKATLKTYLDTLYAAKSQVDEWSVFITVPTAKSYTIVLDCKFAATINEVTTQSASGTCTLTVKINSTALGGTANSVSSSETTQTHSSANAVSAGDNIVLTVSSVSSCVDMSVTIKYTRSLA